MQGYCEGLIGIRKNYPEFGKLQNVTLFSSRNNISLREKKCFIQEASREAPSFSPLHPSIDLVVGKFTLLGRSLVTSSGFPEKYMNVSSHLP